MRQHLGAAALTVGAIVALGSCGSDDSDGGGKSAAPPIDEVAACLDAGGLEVERGSSLSPDLDEAFGVEDELRLSGTGDLVGLGSVTWYVDDAAAEEAFAAGAAVRTEEVARGRLGRVTHDYAGSEAAAELIEGCL